MKKKLFVTTLKSKYFENHIPELFSYNMPDNTKPLMLLIHHRINLILISLVIHTSSALRLFQSVGQGRQRALSIEGKYVKDAALS